MRVERGARVLHSRDNRACAPIASPSDSHAHLQLQSRPGGPSGARPSHCRRRDARLARHRHVRHGDEPSRQGVHLHRRQGRGRSSQAARDPRRLRGPVPAGRGHRRERDRPDEPLGRASNVADYIHTGEWSKKSIKEAGKYGKANVAASSEAEGFTRIPERASWRLTPGAAYVHICSNETIGGVEYHWTPDVGGVPLVADMSSHILSRAARRVEIRRDLRRRAEEHRPRGTHHRHRAQGPPRPRAADHADGVPLEGAGGGRLDGEHAADLRDLHRGPRVRVAARAGRAARRSSRRTSRRPRCSTTTSTRRASTRIPCARKTARA